MAELSDLARVVRSWELPLDIEQEMRAVEAIAVLGESKKFSPDDFALVLEEATERWTTGTVDNILRSAFDEGLRLAPPILDALDARAYFDVYKKLSSQSGDVAGLSHSTTLRLLSRTPLIAHLLREERFSCSQVAKLLAANEASLDVSHGSIAKIARKLSLLPELSAEEAVDKLWEKDEARSTAMFPDSSLSETNFLAGAELNSWLPEIDSERLLVRLSRSEEPQTDHFWPYFQMLHWCLTPIEYFDHPANYPYEFKPRGGTGEALFAKYPAVTGNPFLNNAKAVHTLSGWALSRGNDAAHALSDLVRVVDTLPFVPRRQVARLLRSWLVRVVELLTVEPVPIEVEVTDRLFEQVVEYITENETYTQGVIEQRVVDALAVLAFGKPGWRPRGLGDGVNASNLSRHKLGDVEFANVDGRRAIALEAHGGHLSVTYVKNHARSLSRIIEQRLAESWSALDDPEAWAVEVLFVAHSRDASGLPATETLHGVKVNYKYIDYRELVNRARENSLADDRVSAFELHVIKQLNADTVRESTREKFREIISHS